MPNIRLSRSSEYAENRRQAYEAEVPAHEQLEALFEASQGRPEKLDLIRDRIDSIKSRFAKPVDN